MAPNEKENIYDVHGYLKANMIVLHSQTFDNNKFIPKLIAVNPEQIYYLEEIVNSKLKTKIYFSNTSYEYVYEDINEILDLISQQLEIQEHFKNKNK